MNDFDDLVITWLSIIIGSFAYYTTVHKILLTFLGVEFGFLVSAILVGAIILYATQEDNENNY